MDEGFVGIHFGALRSDYGSAGVLFFPRSTFLSHLLILAGVSQTSATILSMDGSCSSKCGY